MKIEEIKKSGSAKKEKSILSSAENAELDGAKDNAPRED